MDRHSATLVRDSLQHKLDDASKRDSQMLVSTASQRRVKPYPPTRLWVSKAYFPTRIHQYTKTQTLEVQQSSARDESMADMTA